MTYASSWFGPLYVAAFVAAGVAAMFARRLPPAAALGLSGFAVAAAGLFCGFAVYGLHDDATGSAFVLPSVESFPRTATNIPQHLGGANGVDLDISVDFAGELHGVRAPGNVLAIRESAQFDVEGWAFDRAEHARCEGLAIVVDGRAFPALYGVDRSDVAASRGAEYRYSGFRGVLPQHAIRPGRHTVDVRCMGTAGRSYSSPTSYTLEVHP